MTITHTLWAGLLMTAVLLAGCAPTATGESTADAGVPSALRPFDGCEALGAHMRREALDQVTPYGLRGSVPPMAGVVADSAAPEAASAVGARGGETFSTTNVQESGVDEADLVKTDGRSVFAVVDGLLRIVEVSEGRPRLTATLPLTGGWARDMVLHGDDLLLLGEGEPVALPGSPGRPDEGDVHILPPGTAQTRLWLVDVSHPAAPVVRSTMTVDGALLSSRLTGPTARVVVRSTPQPAGLVAPTGGPDATARALAVNRARVEQADARDWLPRVTVDDAPRRPLVECSAVQRPSTTPDLGIVSVLSLDLTRSSLTPHRAQAVLGAADTVYASEDSLYVTTSRWPQPPLPVDPPVPPVEPLPDVPLPVDPPAQLSDELTQPSARSTPEELQPPQPPGDLPPAPAVATEIHRFDLDRQGASYAASGSVPGRVLNQWALSEHDGHLRIATTEDAAVVGDTSTSAVRVLGQRGARLEQVGVVGDLGRGEQIFAVRYAGDVGYVVTFRQTDPLYTLDLSDPAAPRVLGALKIPGYSAYLHPIGDDHLLGVGQDADRQGRVTGVQISLFDTADLAAPERIDQVRLGPQTSTDVEYDHRALLYWPDRDLVVLPVQRWAAGDAGALVLTADPTGGLVERGYVRQPLAGGDMPATIVRSLIVDDHLLTVSPTGVMVTDVDTLAAIGAVSFD